MEMGKINYAIFMRSYKLKTEEITAMLQFQQFVWRDAPQLRGLVCFAPRFQFSKTTVEQLNRNVCTGQFTLLLLKNLLCTVKANNTNKSMQLLRLSDLSLLNILVLSLTK